MSTTDLLIGLVVGGAVGATMVFLAFRGRLGASEAAERTWQERLAERDAAAKEVKAALDAERGKGEELQRELRETLEAKARLDGANTAIDALREQIAAKEDELREYAKRVTALTRDLSEAKQVAESALESRRIALAEKEREVERLIAQEKEHVKAVLAEKEQALASEKRLLEESERILTEKFSVVSVESLKKATEEFLKLAGQRFEQADEASKAELEKRQKEIDVMLKPLAETLDKLERQNKEMEERRVSAFDSIEKGIKTLSDEADQLANALRKPNTRGAWGEMQLQVILENAGMQEGEHFYLQHSTEGDEGRLRTDVVVKLPKGRVLVIDSKAPLETYWEAMNAPDEATRVAKFAAHARLVREYVRKLSNKSYWNRYPSAPDCVVMFLPTEGAYQAAFEADRSLLAEAHQARVYIVNPMTLISMVHIAAYVLNEERLRQNALEVGKVGTELYKRLAKFLGDLDNLGKHLRMTVEDYNRAVGSVDSRVIPAARNMAKLGAGSGDLPELSGIDTFPRDIRNIELSELPESLLDALPFGDDA